MSDIYSMDAIELMNNLYCKVPLQIHDIPYEVSVPNGDIKFSSRSDMVRYYGDWDMKPMDLKEFAKACSNCASEDANVVVWFTNWYRISELVNELDKYFDKVSTLIWLKTNPRPQVRKRSFTMSHEIAVYASRGNYPFNFPSHQESFSAREIPEKEIKFLKDYFKNGVCQGNSKLRDSDNKAIHPTQKPVRLIEDLIRILSNENDIVLDAYAGVLTTAMASLNTSRRFIVNDIDSNYVQAGINWIESKYSSDSYDYFK